MQIVDLKDEHVPLYVLCLEDWSDEAKEAGPRKAIWYEKMKHRGLRVKLAVDDQGEVGGMIQYVPIENSFVEGRDLYVVQCIWVHGHKQGRGNFQKHGMGKALLAAAEEDAKALGAKGIAAWGLWLPFWMRAGWFKKHGFKKADRDGIRVLVWKPFTADAATPRWIRGTRKPKKTPGKVTVTVFVNGWCLAQNLVYERAKRAAAEFGDRVEFVEVDTSERNTLIEWGISDGLFIDGKAVRNGPPPSYDKIRSIIAGRVKAIRVDINGSPTAPNELSNT